MSQYLDLAGVLGRSRSNHATSRSQEGQRQVGEGPNCTWRWQRVAGESLTWRPRVRAKETHCFYETQRIACAPQFGCSDQGFYIGRTFQNDDKRCSRSETVEISVFSRRFGRIQPVVSGCCRVEEIRCRLLGVKSERSMGKIGRERPVAPALQLSGSLTVFSRKRPLNVRRPIFSLDSLQCRVNRHWR